MTRAFGAGALVYFPHFRILWHEGEEKWFVSDRREERQGASVVTTGVSGVGLSELSPEEVGICSSEDRVAIVDDG